MPRVANVMQAFFKGMARRKGMRMNAWAISGKEDTEELWSSRTATTWLQNAYAAAGYNPPPGFSWTSHSLRKGSASAANAIKVPLPDIRYFGGWSTNSLVLEAKYIDFAMAPTKAAYIFFGHLKRDAPVEK